MGATTIEKILARTSGKSVVRPGDVAVCHPDIVVHIDLPMAIEGAWYRPAKVFDPERVAMIFDHAVPSPSIKDASAMAEGRRFAREFGLKLVFDVGQHGISHVVAAEQGLARPGELLVCADSHTCASGALNCAGRGVGIPDALQAITKGVVWYLVTPTIRYEFKGGLGPMVSGKDVFFHIAQIYGAHGGTSIEFGSPGIRALAMSDRRTMTTMSAEIGAEFAIFDYDEVTADYLKGRLDRPAVPAHPDADADYMDVRTVDLADVEPYVILPHSVPRNGVRLSSFDRKIRIDQAFIGSCANGLIEDLRVAANIVRGKKVATGVRFIVTPGSQAVYLQAVREGLFETLVEAGAVVTNSTCGACFGYHMGVLAPGEVCITASPRNFKGRMGSPEASVYLGSPATVAASALTGVITDPRAVAGRAVEPQEIVVMSDSTNLVYTGRVWKFGDLINTDMIMPSAAFRLPKNEQHTLCFEATRPGWAKQVRPGDILVAGENFGMGSSRPIGEVLRGCGIVAVVAESINGLAMRNCVNSSIPAINCAGVAALFEEGDTARIDFLAGRIENVTQKKSLEVAPLAPLLAEIVAAGGVIPMLVKEACVHPEPFVAASS